MVLLLVLVLVVWVGEMLGRLRWREKQGRHGLLLKRLWWWLKWWLKWCYILQLQQQVRARLLKLLVLQQHQLPLLLHCWGHCGGVQCCALLRLVQRKRACVQLLLCVRELLL